MNARPIVAAVLGIALAAPPAAGSDTVRWGRDDAAFARLGPTDAPGAVAELVFRNDERHSSYHEATLEIAGLSVRIELFVNVPGPIRGGSSPDRIVVHVPDGLIAEPPEAIVPEGETLRVLIYPLEAVGM